MKARRAALLEPYKVVIRDVDLPEPAPNQILVRTAYSAVSAGTELAVYTGTHQWLRDPNLPDWKFPFHPGYSAAGEVIAVGNDVPDGWKSGDAVSYPGNHASHELLPLGHERGRLWRLLPDTELQHAAFACVARYGLGAAIRAGLTLGRSAAVLGLGVIGQFALRGLLAAGAYPVIGIDSVAMRRSAAVEAGAHHVIDPAGGDLKQQLDAVINSRGVEIVADATGMPDAIPTAMSLACDGGQVIVVGSPRGRAKYVNFYDDLHRRYIEVTGAHGNMLFEPAHARLAGAWTLDKAQHWLLAAMRDRRFNMAGVIRHTITPEQLGGAYEGLLHKKDEYLGVAVNWL